LAKSCDRTTLRSVSKQERQKRDIITTIFESILTNSSLHVKHLEEVLMCKGLQRKKNKEGKIKS
jgi:hypothetical protein